MATDGTTQPPPELVAEIKAVIARAKAGDVAAVPELRGHLERHPELWQKCGDAAAQAEGAWIALAAGPNLHLRECMTRFAAARRAELTRPGASPAEKMLVDRAVACSLQVEYFSATEANAIMAKEPAKVHQWSARRHAQAQRAFQAAVSALLTVQKLFPATAEQLDPQVSDVVATSVPAAGPETVPTTVPVRVEEPPAGSPHQFTGWNTPTEQPTAVPLRLKVRC